MEVKRVCVSGGHNKKVQGASCYFNEVTEDRKVTEAIRKYMTKLGLKCYVCNDDEGTIQHENLTNIVKNHNVYKRDLDVSVHFNAFRKSDEDGKTKGVEVLVYDKDSKCYELAKKVCESISDLGFTNRGVKVVKNLYFLSHTEKPAMLIEVCFVDDKDDYVLYKKVGADTIGKVIAEAISGKKVVKEIPKAEVAKPSEVTSDSKGFEVPKLKGYKGFSIVDGLKKFGYQSDFKYRSEVWKSLGNKSKYKGEAKQNLKMLNALKKRG